MTQDLRRELRELRRSIPDAELAGRSMAAATLVASQHWWQHSRSIGIYVANDGELDPSPLVTQNRGHDSEFSVPVLDEQLLAFAPISDTTRWQANRYGINEPIDAETRSPRGLDVVLVPSVAVDLSGTRVGMGAGWYDRTFQWCLGDADGTRPLLVAYVHDEQVIDHLDRTPWDVPMDIIVTPTLVHVVREAL